MGQEVLHLCSWYVPEGLTEERLQKLFIEFYKRHYMRNRIVWGYITMLWKSPDSWKRFMLSLGSFLSFARSNKGWQEKG